MFILVFQIIFVVCIGGMVFMLARKMPVLAELPPSKREKTLISKLWRAFWHLGEEGELSSGYWESVKGE